jgi:hypothetical protein
MGILPMSLCVTGFQPVVTGGDARETHFMGRMPMPPLQKRSFRLRLYRAQLLTLRASVVALDMFPWKRDSCAA